MFLQIISETSTVISLMRYICSTNWGTESSQWDQLYYCSPLVKEFFLLTLWLGISSITRWKFGTLVGLAPCPVSVTLYLSEHPTSALPLLLHRIVLPPHAASCNLLFLLPLSIDFNTFLACVALLYFSKFEALHPTASEMRSSSSNLPNPYAFYTVQFLPSAIFLGRRLM